MLTTVKGVYDHGVVVLSEPPPVQDRADVFVTFLGNEPTAGVRQRGKPGALMGQVTIPDDFNEPLEELRDYT